MLNQTAWVTLNSGLCSLLNDLFSSAAQSCLTL